MGLNRKHQVPYLHFTLIDICSQTSSNYTNYRSILSYKPISPYLLPFAYSVFGQFLFLKRIHKNIRLNKHTKEKNNNNTETKRNLIKCISQRSNLCRQNLSNGCVGWQSTTYKWVFVGFWDDDWTGYHLHIRYFNGKFIVCCVIYFCSAEIGISRMKNGQKASEI